MKLPLAITLLLLLPGTPSVAQTAPEAPPATRPGAPTASISAALVALRDIDPATRVTARDVLMGLDRADLPLLRDAVRQMGPARLLLRDVLYDIVQHVFLSGEPYEPDPQNGPFMGVRFGNTFRDLQTPEQLDLPGVVVVSREQGFPAYRALRNGDMIQSIDGTAVQFTDRQQVTETIKTFKPGDQIRFRILRDGQVCVVSVPLMLRPAHVDPEDAERVLRHQRALAYWAEHFGPLLDATEPD